MNLVEYYWVIQTIKNGVDNMFFFICGKMTNNDSNYYIIQVGDKAKKIHLMKYKGKITDSFLAHTLKLNLSNIIDDFKKDKIDFWHVSDIDTFEQIFAFKTTEDAYHALGIVLSHIFNKRLENSIAAKYN